MAQQSKVYLDDSGEVIKPSVDNEPLLDTAPSLKTKTYLDDTGEPISNDVDTPEITSPRGFEGNALDASMASAKGFLKGATLDLPESIMNAITSAPGLMKTSMGPLGDMIFGGDSASDLIGGIKSIPPTMREMWELAKTNPEEFGRTLGQVTGQPLVTAGMAKGTPSMVRGAGAVTEGTGKIMRKYAPMSGTIPRMMEPRIARAIERKVGSGIENVGQRMRSVGKSNAPMSSKLMDDIITNENLADEMIELSRPTRTGRPNIAEQINNLESNTTNILANEMESKGTKTVKDLPKSIDSIMGKPITSMRTEELTRISQIKELPKEILDAINYELGFRMNKPLNKNSKFFLKNR